MTLIQIVYLYLLTVPVFFIIDLIWLGVLAKDFYQKQIGFLLGPVNWVAALVFYLFFIVGILVFAVLPALDSGSLIKALALGVFFGFITYATYDLTNLATLKDWPFTIAVVDIIWGSVLSGSVATISYLIGSRLFI
tara:strand:- start:5240 stop:5647 length:408 start_codon:yes stop_codon:yes gene_type:complete